MSPQELKNYLEKRGLLSLYDAEKELGFCRQSLSKYLAGKRPIPEKICGMYELIINKSGAGYLEEVDGYTEPHERGLFCYFDRKKDESITDCVANVLIHLIQQEII